MSALFRKTPIQHSVFLLLGQGSGSFAAPTTISVGGWAYGLAVGDLNGDKIPDLVVSTSNAQTLSVLLGNGDGTFTFKGFLAGTGLAETLAIAPLRSENTPDIISDCQLPGAVNVYLNTGKASFHHDLSTSVDGTGGGIIAKADFNRDGKPDAAVIGGGGLGVFLGTGSASKPFEPVINFNLGHTISMTVGDFNGDGIPDIAALAGPIQVLLSDGTGGFSAPISTSPPTGMNIIYAADMNGDGKDDLISDSGTILYSNGDGTFSPGTSFPPYNGFIYWIAAADLNGDGLNDLVLIDGAGNEYIGIYINQGNGTFVSKQYSFNENLGEGQPMTLQIADLNGDGILDIVVGEAKGVAVMLGQGKSHFAAPVFYDIAPTSVVAAVGVTVGDFNGDGIPDIALATANSSVGVFVGNGDGTFQIPTVDWTTGGTDQYIISGKLQSQQGDFDDIVNSSLDGIDVLLNTTNK